jgi:hypothetical protein
MPLGIRLDRPSAVGDEGRPRGTSLTISALVVVGVMVGAGVLVGRPFIFTSYALLVGLMTAGVALLGRDRLAPTVIGHLCFLPPAVILSMLVVYTLTLGLTVPGLPFLVAGGLLAMFGVAAGWNDAFDAETIQHTLASSAISYVFWLGTLVVLFVLALLWVAARELVSALTGGAGPTVAAFGLLALLGTATACLYVAVWSLPAIQLTPVDRRDVARERYRLLKRRIMFATIGSWGGVVLLVLWLATGTLGPVLQLFAAPLRVIASVTAIPLASVAGLSLLVATASWATRRATGGFDNASTQTVGAAIAAVCYTVTLLLAAPLLVYLALFSGGLVAGLFVAPLFIYVFLTIVFGLLAVGLVPERAGPSAFAAAGLVAIGIGAGLAGFQSVFVFAAVAGGLVAWDVGTYGLGLTAELGHIPLTRRLELYHGVVAVGVGILGVGLLTLVDFARRSVAAGVGTPLAMGVAVIGVILLLLPLRG